MSAIAVSKITSKGQVTIPESIRDRLDLQTGDRLEWEVSDDGAVALRKVGGSLKDLVGLLGKPPRSLTIEELDAAVQDRFRTNR